MSKPGPISEILFPSIETEASVTLCNTIRTGGSFTMEDLFQAILPTSVKNLKPRKPELRVMKGRTLYEGQA
jgi:hypothetical protein